MTPARGPVRWVYGFLVVQFVCQAALMVPALGPLRTGFRVLAFAGSLLLLVLVPAGGRPYPVGKLALAVVGVTALGLFHPALNTPLAGLATVGLAAAVWGPAAWAARVRFTPATFRTAVLLLWGFQTLSAAVGVLQVYDPGRFAPDPEFVRQQIGADIDGLQVTLDDGRKVFRPMGLSDTPGGAAAAGMFAVVTGFAVANGTRNRLVQLGTVAAAAVGMFCIYLCQVRSVLIVTGVSLGGMMAVMAARGRVARAAASGAVALAVAAGGYVWATAVGEEAVTSRLATLNERSAADVYYANRGRFLEETLDTHLPEYPLGAGPGRWGMMHAYFGDRQNPASRPLWAEIQPTGWVFDGGVPLLVLGYAAAVAAVWVTVRLALTAGDPAFADLAAVVAAFGLGVLVVTLNYPVFVSTTGMTFWLLNAGLYSAATRARRG